MADSHRRAVRVSPAVPRTLKQDAAKHVVSTAGIARKTSRKPQLTTLHASALISNNFMSSTTVNHIRAMGAPLDLTVLERTASQHPQLPTSQQLTNIKQPTAYIFKKHHKIQFRYCLPPL
jgi:hypothetical protein